MGRKQEGRVHFEAIVLGGRVILKWVLNMVGVCWLNSSEDGDN